MEMTPHEEDNMDLLTEARITKINEMAEAVLSDSRRRTLDVLDVPGASASLGLSDREVRSYSISRAIQNCLGLLDSSRTEGGIERECANALGQRFEVPLGSFAVPMDVLEYRSPSPSYFVGSSAPSALSFIDMLRNRSIVAQLGVQRLTDLKDDAAIPRQIAGTTITWLSPTTSVTPTDPSFGQASAKPKSGVVITEVSEQLMRQSAADQIIKTALAGDMAVGIDAAVISGAGGVEPLGIVNTSGIGTVAGTSLAYSGLVGVQKTVADANAILNPKALGYATTPTVAEQLKGRQRFTSTDSPLWRGALHDGEVEGVRAVASKQVPSATLLYGDWSTVWVGEWGPLMLSVDRGGNRFNQARVGIRALWMVDVFVTAPTAFVKITSIT